MKHKKGALLYAPVLVVFTVLGLIYAWSEISARYNVINEEIGERQFGLINTYHLGERYRFYIDQSAKYSAYQGVYDLAKNGGCFLGDLRDGYRLWGVGSPTPGLCFPSADDSKNGLLDFFKNHLSDYLSSYSPISSISVIKESYDLSFDGKNIMGIAKLDPVLPLPELSTGSPGTYTINPSFKVNLENYDFLDYDEIRRMALEILDRCENNGLRRSTVNCVTEEESKKIFNNQNRPNDDNNNLELSTCPDGREPFQFLKYDWELNLIVRHSIYGYCVESDNPLVYAYEEGDPTVDDSETLGLKKINYRFALPFEDLDCTTDFPLEYPSTHPDYDDLVGFDPQYNFVFSTRCKEASCERYHQCDGSEKLCYCVKGENVGGSKGDTECIGSCFPYCSNEGKDVEVDKDEETRCTEHSCWRYISCNSFNPSPSSEEMCACPVPGLDRDITCSGNDCIILHCDRDFNPTSQCKSNRCDSYDFCSFDIPAPGCGCQSGLHACEGSVVNWYPTDDERGCRKLWKRSTPFGCGSQTEWRRIPGCLL